jgi:hypothetical protein
LTAIVCVPPAGTVIGSWFEFATVNPWPATFNCEITIGELPLFVIVTLRFAAWPICTFPKLIDPGKICRLTDPAARCVPEPQPQIIAIRAQATINNIICFCILGVKLQEMAELSKRGEGRKIYFDGTNSPLQNRQKKKLVRRQREKQSSGTGY